MFAAGSVAPELAHVTARFAALAPFAPVATIELLPVGGAANAGTVRNRTMRVGARLADVTAEDAQAPATAKNAVTPPVIVGLDGGYVRNRHRRPERNFEVIAGKVIGPGDTQHRFAFARNGGSAAELAGVLVRAGVREGMPATDLSDGDAGLWHMQRQAQPVAAIVLDLFHIAMRFDHAHKSATGLCAGRPMLIMDSCAGATSSARNGGSSTAVGRVAW
jgi:hypothetical protein